MMKNKQIEQSHVKRKLNFGFYLDNKNKLKLKIRFYFLLGFKKNYNNKKINFK